MLAVPIAAWVPGRLQPPAGCWPHWALLGLRARGSLRRGHAGTLSPSRRHASGWDLPSFPPCSLWAWGCSRVPLPPFRFLLHPCCSCKEGFAVLMGWDGFSKCAGTAGTVSWGHPWFSHPSFKNFFWGYRHQVLSNSLSVFCGGDKIQHETGSFPKRNTSCSHPLSPISNANSFLCFISCLVACSTI